MSATGDELESLTPKSVEGIPEKYRQYVEQEGDKAEGQVTWADGAAQPSHSEILHIFGLSPKEWRIRSQRRSRWEQRSRADGSVWLNAIKITAEAIPYNDPAVIAEDFDLVMRDISKWKPLKRLSVQPGRGPSGAYVHQLGDIQTGKGQEGGSPATFARALQSLQAGIDGLENLRRLGFSISKVCLPSTGDLLEQTSGFYPGQTFSVDMDMRTQRREFVKLLMAHIRGYAPRCDELDLTGVAGNHGESRNENGKQITTVADSDDLLMLDWAKSICDEAGYDNVTFDIPVADPLVHSFTAEGVTVALAHGNQFSKGQGAANKAHEWLKGQMLGDRIPRDIRLLLTGHFHSFQFAEFSEKVGWAQCPAQDGGSHWFSSTTGLSARTGALTLVVGDNVSERGFDYLRVV